jgi:hypothetical protein
MAAAKPHTIVAWLADTSLPVLVGLGNFAPGLSGCVSLSLPDARNRLACSASIASLPVGCIREGVWRKRYLECHGCARAGNPEHRHDEFLRVRFTRVFSTCVYHLRNRGSQRLLCIVMLAPSSSGLRCSLCKRGRKIGMVKNISWCSAYYP